MKKILLLLALLLPIPAFATNFYTSSTGSDTANNCQTIGSPCNLTNGFANEMAQITAANGDVIHMCAGACDGSGSATVNTYLYCNSFDSSPCPNGTTWANALTIKPYPGETITWNGINPSQPSVIFLVDTHYMIFGDPNDAGRHFTIDAVNMANGVPATYAILGGFGTSHIRYINMEVKNAPWSAILAVDVNYNEYINIESHHSCGHGIYVSQGNHNLVRGGQYHDNGHDQSSRFPNCDTGGIASGFGVQLNDGPKHVDDNIVEGVRSYDNQGAMALSAGFRNIVRNNLFYDNVGGILVLNQSDSYIVNNTIVGTMEGPPITVYDQYIDDLIIKNNIFWDNFTNTVTDNGVGTVQANNLAVDPLFTNYAAKDFTLTDTSPALETGATLAEVLTDFNGNTRPQGSAYDIGAHERINIVGGSGSGNVQTSRATEAFTGAAGDLAGPDWAQVGTGGLTCRKNGSGRLTASATSQDGCLARQISATFSANLYSEIKYISVGTSTSGESFIGPALLASDGDGYAGGVYVAGGDTTTFVGEYVNGLFSTILASTTSTSWAANDTMALEWNSADGHIWLLKNDIVVLNPFDTTYTTGLKPGVVVAGDALGDDADLGDINFTPGTCTINLQQPGAGSINFRPATTAIHWTTQNCTGNVTLQASWNGGTTWLPAFATVAFNSSPYTWDTVIGESATVKVRVCSGSDCGTSEAFTVHGEYVK